MRIALLTAGDSAAIENLLGRSDLCEVARWFPSVKPPRNLRERESFDRQTAQRLRKLDVDYVFAAGYPYVITEPMLDAFPDRIIAVHDGDLTERDEWGHRRCVGSHAVLDAVLSGATTTRSSLYIVTREVGGGPLLLVGPRHLVPPLVQDAMISADYEAIAIYARLHRRWMRRSWGTLLLRAVEILAAGSLQIIDDMVWIDGAPGPCRLGEAPDVCQQLEDRIQRSIPSSCPFIQT